MGYFTQVASASRRSPAAHEALGGERPQVRAKSDRTMAHAGRFFFREGRLEENASISVSDLRCRTGNVARTEQETHIVWRAPPSIAARIPVASFICRRQPPRWTHKLPTFYRL